MLSRDQFCLLTILDVETIKSRAKRNLLPFTAEKQRGYTLFDALLVILADEQMGAPSMSTMFGAAGIIRKIAPMLASEWSNIGRSANGKKGEPVVWISLWKNAGAEGLLFVGNTSEAAKNVSINLSRYPTVMGGSVTRAVEILRERAAVHDVEIPKTFWSETPRGF